MQGQAEHHSGYEFLGSFASGIYLHTGGGNWLYGNYIGTNFAGDTRVANQRGIWWETPLAGIQVTLAGATELTGADGRFVFRDIAPGTYTLSAALPAGLTATLGPVTVNSQRGAVVGIPATACLDFNGNGRTDVQDIMQVAERWNDPAYDIAPPFGSPIDILDISAIAEAWDSACQ